MNDLPSIIQFTKIKRWHLILAQPIRAEGRVNGAGRKDPWVADLNHVVPIGRCISKIAARRWVYLTFADNLGEIDLVTIININSEDAYIRIVH
jgi:hypothetical protein